MKWLAVCSALAVMILVFTPWQNAHACTRILYETGTGTYITGRGMDWNDPTAATALWVFPRGMKRDEAPERTLRSGPRPTARWLPRFTISQALTA